MKKISLAAKLVTVAVLTVPFIYERDENGGLKLRAVLYDINIAKKEDGTKDIRIDIGGIFKDQIKAVKKIFADISASRRKNREEEDIDADFADIDFTEEDEAAADELLAE